MGLKLHSIETILFDGKDREYNVMDNPEKLIVPRYFISYGNGKPFISSEVPKNYRHHMVRHELLEFEKIEDSPTCCLQALVSELEEVPTIDRNDYIPFRARTFKSLIDFLKTKNQLSPLIHKLHKSLRYLESINPENNKSLF